MSWKKLSSKVIHENSWFKLREDDVLRPNGSQGKYYYIDEVNSVMMIAEDDDGLIYLVGQTRYPTGNNFSWELICGGVREGGDFFETAKQELREEGGLESENWTELGYFYPYNGVNSDKTKLYLVKDLKIIKAEPEPTEDMVIKKTSLENIIEMIRANEITDAMTIAAIYKYILYKKII